MRYVTCNVPYVLDFFAALDGLTSAREGYLVDLLPAPGGFTLFVGKRLSIQVDIHAARAVHRLFNARTA